MYPKGLRGFSTRLAYCSGGPVSGPPRLLRSSPLPHPGLSPAYTPSFSKQVQEPPKQALTSGASEATSGASEAKSQSPAEQGRDSRALWSAYLERSQKDFEQHPPADTTQT
ncbi:MAG TPA: hypothetical protein VGB96_17595, partial [Archangium sp.]